MKVVAFNGSARKDGNTAILVRAAFKELEKAGIKTELVQLSGKKVHGCTACMKCREKKDRRCVIDDFANECIAKMDEADGIILASPTYFSDVSAEMKALIDRSGFVAMGNDSMFRRKVGAAVVAVRSTRSIRSTTSSSSTRWWSRARATGTSGSGLRRVTWKTTMKELTP
jgi:multimeric flavodoxin WrbA